LHFFISNGNGGLIGAKLSVAFDLDLWHDLETGFEPQRFTFMQVQVGDPWLRDRDQTLLFRFFAKVARDQGFHDIALQVLGETLANDGGGHVSSAKTRQTAKLLILLNQRMATAKETMTAHWLRILNEEIVSCTRCPRLVAYRAQIAREKRRAYHDWEYWGKPVPGFGDPNARVVVLGLAPGAHGSNRTGRPFTGDASGKFMYPVLYEAGFSNQPNATDRNDGLKLRDL